MHLFFIFTISSASALYSHGGLDFHLELRALVLPVKQDYEGQFLKGSFFGNAFLSPSSRFAGSRILSWSLPLWALDYDVPLPPGLRGFWRGADCWLHWGPLVTNHSVSVFYLSCVCGCLCLSYWEFIKLSGYIGWRFSTDFGCFPHGIFHHTSCSPLSITPTWLSLSGAHASLGPVHFPPSRPFWADCRSAVPTFHGGLFISHHHAPSGLTVVQRRPRFTGACSFPTITPPLGWLVICVLGGVQVTG